MLKLEIINSVERFKEIRDDWNRLLSNSHSDTIFLTWEWLYTWWQVFGRGSDLLILLYKDNTGCLKGALPLYIKKKRILDVLTIKELRFIGSGADISSEYLDFICWAGLENEIINNFMNYLCSGKSFSHILCFTDINQESESIKHITKYLISKNMNSLIMEQKPLCPVIKFDKTGGWDAFLKSRNKSLRQNIRRWNKKIKEVSKIEFTTYNSFSSSGTILFDKFIELHGVRREQKNNKSRFSNGKYLEFHKNLIPLVSQNKWLQFSILQFNSNIVAAKYNFQYKNKVYSYQGGWNSKFAKYNVAQVLFSYILEKSANNGIDEIDMLRGEEDHKMRWANGLRKKNKIIAANSKIGDTYIAFCRAKSGCLRIAKKLLPEKIRKRIEDKIYK